MGYVQGKAKDISKRRIVGYGKEGFSGGGSTSPATDTSDKNVLLVHLATTTNVILSGLFAIDGVVPDSGMLVLVWQQTDQTQNGVYEVSSGAWTKLYTDIGITKQPIVVVPVLGTANIAHQFNRISIDNLNNFIDIGSVYGGTTLPDGTTTGELLVWNNSAKLWDVASEISYTNNTTPILLINNNNEKIQLEATTVSPRITVSSALVNASAYLRPGQAYFAQPTQRSFCDYRSLYGQILSGGSWEESFRIDTLSLKILSQTSTYAQKAIWNKDGEMVWVYDDYAELDSDYLLTANTYPTNASEFLIRTNFDAFYAVVTYDITVVFSSNTAISDGIEFQLKNADSSTPTIFDMTGHENRHTEATTGESPIVSDINATSTVQYIPTNWGTLYTKVNFQGSFKIKSNADSDSGYIALFFRKITGTDLVTLKAGSNVKIDFYHA